MKKDTQGAPRRSRDKYIKNYEFSELSWQTRAILLVEQNEAGFEIATQ
jgi:hypothetical protein